MNFKSCYQDGSFRYSFEVFPPKDEAQLKDLFGVLGSLQKYDPAFISVTYGAMGSTRDLTRDLALRIWQDLGLNTAFHFTCVGSGPNEIEQYVEKLKSKGINLVVALRGDPPMGMKQFVKPEDGFAYANELVSFLKSLQGLSIAVAGYPEGHVEAPNKEVDLINLKRKVDAGADIVLTQLFFNNEDYFDFVERARRIGITVPIIPGIMPILSLKQIQKIAGLCGAKIPLNLSQALTDCQGNLEAMRQVGIDHALTQCRELKARGVPGIHFYILNKVESVSKILEALES